MKIGALFQLEGFWVGAHYSRYNKRVCINLLPCFTVWICANDGKIASKNYLTIENYWGKLVSWLGKQELPAPIMWSE